MSESCCGDSFSFCLLERYLCVGCSACAFFSNVKMKEVLKFRLIPVILALVLIALSFVTSAECQWQKLSQIDRAYIGGAFAYRTGTFWAGNVSLYKSTDSCKTWTKKGPFSTDPIMGIDFYDKVNGAVILQFGQVYITRDGGNTWTLSTTISQNVVTIRFGTTPLEIYIGTESPGVIIVTHDGGSNWSEMPIPSADWVQDYVNQSDGSTLAFTCNIFRKTGTLYRTRDHGISWVPLPATTNADGWSLAADSCDLKTLYVVNEQSAGSTEDRAIVWVTTNGGSSWANSLDLNTADLAGSIALGTKAAFVPTTTVQGIMRTTDKGATWKSIGGPPSHLDCRQIVALSDNEIYAIDDLGDVFVTKNSGGDSLIGSRGQPLTLSANALFTRDTLSPCQTVSATLQLIPPPCSRAFIGSIRVTGIDSAFYAIGHYPPAFLNVQDSIVLFFSPLQIRNYSGSLIITLTDGTTFIVTLTGSAKDDLSLATQDVPVAVLGEETSVPISIHDRGVKRDCDLAISFDTTYMVYDGTKTLAGRLVAETVFAPGKRVLHFLAADFIADSIGAMAQFRYYPINDGFTTVGFDSLRALGIGVSCQAVELPVASKVTYATGCGSPTLSRYLRYAEFPQLTLSPNPAGNLVSLYSNRDVDGATIEVIDALGRTCQQFGSNLRITRPVAIRFNDLKQGTYFIRIRTASGLRTLRVVRLE